MDDSERRTLFMMADAWMALARESPHPSLADAALIDALIARVLGPGMSDYRGELEDLLASRRS